MLNVNYTKGYDFTGSSVSQPFVPQPNSLIDINHQLLITGSLNKSKSVALRCETPLDALELDSHGYHNGYFEFNNEVSEASLVLLKALGLNVIAYFIGEEGSRFDLQKMTTYAAKHKVILCEVRLPFHPANFAIWDEWQWRVFESRLSTALATVLRSPCKSYLIAGGKNYATIH